MSKEDAQLSEEAQLSVTCKITGPYAEPISEASYNQLVEYIKATGDWTERVLKVFLVCHAITWGVLIWMFIR